MSVSPVPEGFHSVTPYLLVKGADKLAAFLGEAFGAEELMRNSLPDGTVLHMQVRVGDSVIMISDATADYGPNSSMLYVYVDDVDAVYARALAAGAVEIRPPTDEFYGDRAGGVADPCGNQWWIATHVEDVGPDELARRHEKHAAERAGGGAKD